MKTIKIFLILCLVSSSFAYAQNNRIANELLSEFSMNIKPPFYEHNRCGDILSCIGTCMMLYKAKQAREEYTNLTIKKVKLLIDSGGWASDRRKCSDDEDCIKKCVRYRPSISDYPDFPKRCNLRSYYWTLNDPYVHNSPDEDMDFYTWLFIDLHSSVQCSSIEECTLVCDDMYNSYKERAECREVSVRFR